MSEKGKYIDIEDLFRSEFRDFEPVPSLETEYKLMRKLERTEFFRFNPIRFNVWYLLAIIAAALLTLILLIRPGRDTIKHSIPVSVTVPESSSDNKVIVGRQEKPTMPFTGDTMELKQSDKSENGNVSLKRNAGEAKNNSQHKSDLPDIVNSPGLVSSMQYNSKKDSSVITPMQVQVDNQLVKNERKSYVNILADKPGSGKQEDAGGNKKTIWQTDSINEARASVGPEEINKDAEYFIKFPNAFIPDPHGPTGGYYSAMSDENARVFHPVHSGVAEYHLRIYSKLGILIYESNDINRGWDGYIRGQLTFPGVYLWRASGKYRNGDSFNNYGDVTLLKSEEN